MEGDSFIQPPDFVPKCSPGLHLPEESKVSALEIFELFFDTSAINMIIQSTLSYVEHTKEKKRRYSLFMKTELNRQLLKAFLGVLILLGIHNVKNYRKAWSVSNAQVMIRLDDLMTCQTIELIGCFLLYMQYLLRVKLL